MEKEEQIRKLKKLWKHFKDLESVHERNQNKICFRVQFLMQCDVDRTKEIILATGLNPSIKGKIISVEATFPTDVLDAAGIK